MDATPSDVLRFWLGEPGDPPLAKAESWWKKSPAFDREITERFEDTLERGRRGELADWQTTPRGRLALVILYDQLSRNMFRGTPRSFAQDELALAVAKQAFAAGDDRLLTPIEVGFLAMPFVHAEDLAMQDAHIEHLTKLLGEPAVSSDEKLREYIESSLRYARMHRVIIERFGRFPHRNAVLGRPTTEEEAHFLTQPNSSF